MTDLFNAMEIADLKDQLYRVTSALKVAREERQELLWWCGRYLTKPGPRSSYLREQALRALAVLERERDALEQERDEALHRADALERGQREIRAWGAEDR